MKKESRAMNKLVSFLSLGNSITSLCAPNIALLLSTTKSLVTLNLGGELLYYFIYSDYIKFCRS